MRAAKNLQNFDDEKLNGISKLKRLTC